jgi:hypothetical protein
MNREGTETVKERRLKFRAWDKQKKVMVDKFILGSTSPTWAPFPIEWPDLELRQQIRDYDLRRGDLLGGEYSLTDWGNYYGIEEYEVMQWTGLHDKTGKEIFEGDIVNGGCYNGSYRLGVVTYVKNAFVAVPVGRFAEGIDERFEGMEIIGNIYSSPDLIKE